MRIGIDALDYSCHALSTFVKSALHEFSCPLKFKVIYNLRLSIGAYMTHGVCLMKINKCLSLHIFVYFRIDKI